MRRTRSSAGGPPPSCGGTVIAPNWVLTAAHCFVSGSTGRQSLTARDILLVAGETELPRSLVAKAGDPRLLRARAVVVHPQFDIRTFSNDIAPRGAGGAHAGESRPAAGRGGGTDRPRRRVGRRDGLGFHLHRARFDTAQLPTALQEAELPVVSVAACRQAYSDSTMRAYSLDQRNLCAGFQEGGRDACQGDSGGPSSRGQPMAGRKWV